MAQIATTGKDYPATHDKLTLKKRIHLIERKEPFPSHRGLVRNLQTAQYLRVL